MKTLQLTAADILLNTRITPFGLPPKVEEQKTLALKMDELIASGYELDDLLGLVIPLLMDGKVRLDLSGGDSERMELVSEIQKLPRTAAIALFDAYAASKRDTPKGTKRQHASTMLITLPKTASMYKAPTLVIPQRGAAA